MRLHYPSIKNFGDLLNPWLWPQLLPGVFDDSETGLRFSGIGSWLAPSSIEKVGDRMIVFGTGGGYASIKFSFGRQFPWKTYPLSAAPENRASMGEKLKNSFKIYCVRGPLTADLLGLEPEMAVADPAVLTTTIDLPVVARSSSMSFMPHYRTAESTDIEGLCRETALEYIDPGEDVEKVLHKIRRSRLLLTEALHGAVAADAFRVPWIPVLSSDRILRFKWEDYCASMGLSYDPVRIRTVFRASKIVATRVRPRFNPRVPLLAKLLIHTRARLGNPRKREVALNSLLKACAAPPVLSPDSVLHRAVERLEERLEQLKKDRNASRWPWGETTDGVRPE